MSRLPVELWLNVLAYCDSSKDKTTLGSLCLVCKSLLHLARPILYHTLSGEDMDQHLLLDTLSVGPSAAILAASVRGVTINYCLCLERILDPDLGQAELEDVLEERWSAEELGAAQAALTTAWTRCNNALRNCISVVKLEFVFDCETKGRYEFEAWTQEDVRDLVPLPTTASLLNLPLVKSLKELSICSVQNAHLDYSQFAHLILASPKLFKLCLSSTTAESFFETLTQAIAHQPLTQLALQYIIWQESSEFEPAQWFDEIIRHLANIPCLRSVEFAGPAVYYEALRIMDNTVHLRLPHVTKLQLGDLTPFHQNIQDRILRDISAYFPSLATITLSVHQAVLYGDQNTTFPYLQSLTIIDRHQYTTGVASAFPFQLIRRNFAPSLINFQYQIVNAGKNEEARQRLSGLRSEVNEQDAAKVDSNVQVIELECGGIKFRLERYDEGDFGFGFGFALCLPDGVDWDD